MLRFKGDKMREILYRGWSDEANEGKWIEGIPQYYPADGGGEWRIRIWKVYPESIGQYTGRMDSKGKKIFEGHRVCVNRYHKDGVLIASYTGVVEYDESKCCFIIIHDDNNNSEPFQDSKEVEYEVVKNVYQRAKSE